MPPVMRRKANPVTISKLAALQALTKRVGKLDPQEPSRLLQVLRRIKPKQPRRVSSSIGYYKGAKDQAFQLGVLQLLKHAGVDGQNAPKLQASIMGFNKQAGAMLGRLLGKGVNLAGKGLGMLGRGVGRQMGGAAKGFGQTQGNKGPAWLRSLALKARQNPRTAAGVALGAGAGGLALANREPQPKLPSGRQVPQGFYGQANPYAGFY